MHNVFRRVQRLEARLVAATPGTVEIRILLVHPEGGVAGVLVLETDKPTMEVPPTPEEVERVRAGFERRRVARQISNGGRQLTRAITRRLKQLETRASMVEKAHADPHTLCFISVDHKVVHTFDMGTGKWTHFDPPRDRTEFEPIT